jgi:hypothetical protein
MIRKNDSVGLFRALRDQLRKIMTRRGKEPEDPYAYVMAPLRRPPGSRNAAATAELDTEER